MNTTCPETGIVEEPDVGPPEGRDEVAADDQLDTRGSESDVEEIEVEDDGSPLDVEEEDDK